MTQMTFFFFGIMAVILIAMGVHSFLDKRKIRKGMERLTKQFKGKVLQESRFNYPRLHTEREGRTFDLFFELVKVGRHHILYSVYTMTTSLPHSLLFIKKGAYQPIKDEVQFAGEHGDLLPDIADPFEGRSRFPEWAQQVYRREGVRETVDALSSFSSLQVGPDAIVVGKPYEGESDTDTDNVLSVVRILERLAYYLEKK